PGHVTSAMIVFSLFVERLIKKIGGHGEHPLEEIWRIKARLSRNVASAQGREDYIRVRLEKGKDGAIYAYPVLGKSGLISTMVKAHGLIKIDMNTEGLEKGEVVDVILF
ncbi:MAG TPA: molybdopterin molybdenumtransferase MoeA, partial [Syntrophaceae bacterium]|nr:molybdopterin molybdenumtransferase MoeA [Syntrophaceae bacterium]